MTNTSGEQAMTPVSGSDRTPVAGAQRVQDTAADAELTVSVILRRRTDADLSAPSGSDPAQRREEFAERAGADPAELQAVERYLQDAGMEVTADLGRRTVTARGTAAQAQRAFGVSLGRYEAATTTYRGREGQVRLPAQLAEYTTAVLGLDDRDQARAHLKLADAIDEADLPDVGKAGYRLLPDPPTVGAGAAAQPKPQPLWTTQVAELYDFPTDVDGSGQTIAILELGGGYTDLELDAYFTRAGVQRPKIIAVGVDGRSNQPTDPRDPHADESADGEVLLDIEIAGTVAPNATIVVYFAPNTDAGFADALSTAVHDAANNPSVVSISWGGPEDAWTDQAREAFDAVLVDAESLGVTVLCASGDHGAGDASPARDGKPRVDYPASSPYAVACGGTALVGASSKITAEAVWNDHDGWATGGGVSRIYPTPRWQRVDHGDRLEIDGFAGRGVPDVAGNADGVTGYITLIHGRWTPSGGTSAVAPLYAGLIALINQTAGEQVGRRFPVSLYAANAAQLDNLARDITEGDNSVPRTPQWGPAVQGYRADKSWDPCTGLGSMRGRGLRDFLGGVDTSPA